MENREKTHLREKLVEQNHAVGGGLDLFGVLNDSLEGLARQFGTVSEEKQTGNARAGFHILKKAKLTAQELHEELG